RTGIPGRQVEALEAGDLSAFPDQRSALTAVRRYADLTHLDGDRFVEVVREQWGRPPAGGAKANGVAQSAYAAAATGHLTRYPGDGTHLRAFTQTAEVPGVKRTAPPAGNGHDVLRQFSDTGAFPAVPARYGYIRPAPVLLRGAVWLTAMVLAVALAGLAVAHWQLQWLKDIHVVRTPVTATPATPGPTGRPGAPAHSALVTQTDAGPGSFDVSVRAANYSVKVAAWGRCWTIVHTPQSFSPVFAATLPAGQVKVFDAVDGQMTVSMSALLVTVQVQINGNDVKGWVFKPSTVPSVLNFNSVSPA
ncbi:MAG TPA: helix-turn-helix domain-containing protein, partial [Acidimicrobiales bacterium]